MICLHWCYLEWKKSCLSRSLAKSLNCDSYTQVTDSLSRIVWLSAAWYSFTHSLKSSLDRTMSLEDLLNLYIFHMPDFLSKYSFASVANQIGCPEGALKLIFSLLIAYPIGILYQLLIIKCPLNVKHLYFATLGFSIGYMNYGLNLIHSLIAIIIVRLILVGLRGNKIAGPVCFTFCTSYLLWGYYKTQSEVYTFEWTIPQCVLTLRLIAVAFDVCDGYTSRDANPSSTGSSVSNDEALTQIPSFLELFGHSYFPASFLVGPQFGVKKYLDFVTHHHPVLQFRYVMTGILFLALLHFHQLCNL